MKKIYLLLVILFIYSCMLTLTSCSKKTVDNNNNVIVNDEIRKIDGNAEKIVEPGYEKLEELLDDEASNKKFQGSVLLADGDDIVFAKAYGYAMLKRK